jgi:hypothetical protein
MSGIRPHDPSVRARGDILCLRPRGHCDSRNVVNLSETVDYIQRNNSLIKTGLSGALLQFRYSFNNVNVYKLLTFKYHCRCGTQTSFRDLHFVFVWYAMMCNSFSDSASQPSHQLIVLYWFFCWMSAWFHLQGGCRGSVDRSPASHPCGPRWILGQVMWILLWTQYHWGTFSPRTLVSPANSNCTN